MTRAKITILQTTGWADPLVGNRRFTVVEMPVRRPGIEKLVQKVKAQHPGMSDKEACVRAKHLYEATRKGPRT